MHAHKPIGTGVLFYRARPLLLACVVSVALGDYVQLDSFTDSQCLSPSLYTRTDEGSTCVSAVVGSQKTICNGTANVVDTIYATPDCTGPVTSNVSHRRDAVCTVNPRDVNRGYFLSYRKQMCVVAAAPYVRSSLMGITAYHGTTCTGSPVSTQEYKVAEGACLPDASGLVFFRLSCAGGNFSYAYYSASTCAAGSLLANTSFANPVGCLVNGTTNSFAYVCSTVPAASPSAIIRASAASLAAAAAAACAAAAAAASRAAAFSTSLVAFA